MKKPFLKLLLVLLLIYSFVPLFQCQAYVYIPNPLNTNSFSDLINKIIDVIFKLALAVAPIMLIIAGIMFMTAGGEPGKIQNAQNLAKWVIIGLIIAILSLSIKNFLWQTFINK